MEQDNVKNEIIMDKPKLDSNPLAFYSPANENQKRGSYVSRSVYQKVVEENRKLLLDIHLLTQEKYSLSPEKTLVIIKWRKKFAEDKEFNELLVAACKQYIKEHPEFDITNPEFDITKIK